MMVVSLQDVGSDPKPIPVSQTSDCGVRLKCTAVTQILAGVFMYISQLVSRLARRASL